MSDMVKDLAQSGGKELIEVADTSLTAAIKVIRALKNTAAEAGHGGVRLGDAIADSFIDELEHQKDSLVSNMKEAFEGVTDPLGELP
jgi:hypothetical protein